MSKPPKRPRDPIQLAKAVGDVATGAAEKPRESARSAAARPGGLKGGKRRAIALTPEQRSDIARIAAAARWKKGS